MNQKHRLIFEPRIFITRRPHDFILITEGETGYRIASPFLTQELVDKHHKVHGISPAQIEAAILCSMFDCWENFDKITVEHETTDTPANESNVPLPDNWTAPETQS